MHKLTASLGAAALVAGMAAPALAHVTVQPNEAPAGEFFRFVVRVPNERDNAATTSVEVSLPDLVFVSFQPKAGWERSVTMRDAEQPIEAFGEQITEVVDTVTWQGGEIAPNEFEEFAFSARVPDEETVLEFPAVQTYDNGEVVRWVGPPDSDEPAARVEVIAVGEEDRGTLATLAAVEDRTGGLAWRTWLGVGLGALGVVLGALALATTRRRREPARPGGRDEAATSVT